jgi:2-polyprenyl-3-methyl-5-hydroxy-6-metoxy-1,4-benzoquinol methylase
MLNNPYDGSNPCGFCKEKNSAILYKTVDIWDNAYTLNACFDCHAIFLAPRPDAAMLARAYDDSYYGAKEEKFNNPFIEKTLDFFRMGRARRLASRLQPGAGVLDIGCGNGKFLGYMRSLGDYRISGIELPGNSAQRAARVPGIQLKVGRLAPDDYPAEHFDAITMFHVFEHLEEPRETLSMINAILKPGGLLMMSFPNIDSLQARMFKGKWLHLDPPRHLFFFKPGDIVSMMDKMGFDCKRVKYFSLEQNPFGMAQSLLNTLLRKREVLFERLKGNTAYAPEYGAVSVALQKGFFILSSPFFILTDAVVSSLKMGATVEFIFEKRK